MSLPLCSVCVLISMPWFAKKPFWMPSVIGRAFEIGSVSTVTVVSVDRAGEADAIPVRTVSAATTTAASAGNFIKDPPFRGLSSATVRSQAPGVKDTDGLYLGHARRRDRGRWRAAPVPRERRRAVPPRPLDRGVPHGL